MSTRCWIGQKREDGIHAFYCHCDGLIKYPHVGYTLTHFYHSEDTVSTLVDLCERTGTNAVYDTLEETSTEMFGDEFMGLKVFNNKKDYVTSAPFDIEGIFLFENGKWKYWCGSYFKEIPWEDVKE